MLIFIFLLEEVYVMYQKDIVKRIMNFYGKAMREYLPYKGFKWIKFNNEFVNGISIKVVTVYMDISQKLIQKFQKNYMINMMIYQ